jgi:putative Ca2+/H+ antiporter (TMEM165/GDT1 family)
VAGVAAVIFAAGAAILFKGAMKSCQAAKAEAEALVAEEEAAITTSAIPTSVWKMATTSFVVLFVAEWGDLSQLLTASQSARTGEPVSVFIGAWLALVLVAGLAVLAGRWIFSTVPLHRVRFISAGVLAVLAGSAIAEVFSG